MSKEILQKLNELEKVINEITDGDLLNLVRESGLSEEDAKQFEIIENIILKDVQ